MIKKLALICTLFTLPAHAGTIDFEGLGDLVGVASLSTSDNTVAFNCGSLQSPANCTSFHYGSPAAVFQPGDTPVTGFGAGTSVGFVGLHDRVAPSSGANIDEFFFQFTNAVSSFGLDLIDHDFPGNVFTLTLFSNADFTGLLDSFSLPFAGDATVVPLELFLSGSTALSASLTQAGNIDNGIGIDNLRFTTAVPAPAASTIIALSLFLIAAARYRRLI